MATPRFQGPNQPIIVAIPFWNTLSFGSVVESFQSDCGNSKFAGMFSRAGCDRAIIGKHPARDLPFDDVWNSIMDGMKESSIACSMDDWTGLEIFNSAASAPQGEAQKICSGLVCHPANMTVVATPLVRFKDHKA